MDKKYKVKKADWGVTVARFQLPKLHEAHIELINKMLNNYQNVLIVLGISPINFSTKKNPLNLAMRKQMIKETFNTNRIKVAYLEDQESNFIWSDKLDSIVAKFVKSKQTVMLCGGRDSFLPYYKNNFPTVQYKDFIQTEFLSATSIRNEIMKTSSFNEDFRAGVTYNACNMIPRCVPAIDLLIRRDDTVLLGKRVNDTKYSFVGGWVYPGETFEQACIRVGYDKCNLTLNDDYLAPIKSFANFDWRFRGEVDDLTSMLFLVDQFNGLPEPKGNITKLKYIKYTDILDKITNTHYPIAEYVKNNFFKYSRGE